MNTNKTYILKTGSYHFIQK